MRKLLWILALVPVLAVAQPSQEQVRLMARTEATRQGVDPDELERRLQARGINTAALTMSDVARVQPIVEEEIAKIKAAQSDGLPAVTLVPSPKVDSTKLNTRIEVAEVETFETDKILKVKPESSVFGKHIFQDGSITTFTGRGNSAAPCAKAISACPISSRRIWSTMARDFASGTGREDR